jgi:hypothetical protein
MAKLISEDVETKSSFEIVATGEKILHGEETWQLVAIRLTSGTQVLTTESLAAQENCVLCRIPRDEIAQLLYLLNEIVKSRIDSFSFEPLEPFFEFNVEYSADQGFKVEAWIDAGNAHTGTYTFDACGIRFHTTKDGLSSFIIELEREFPC